MISKVRTLNFKDFEVNLSQLIKPSDNNIIALFKSSMIVGELNHNDVHKKIGITWPTLKRAINAEKKMSEYTRCSLLNFIQLNENISIEILKEFEINIQKYFYSTAMKQKDEQEKAINALRNMQQKIKNSLLEIMLYMINFVYYGVNPNYIKITIKLCDSLNNYFPDWFRNILDVVILLCHAYLKNTYFIYEKIHLINQIKPIDVWQEYRNGKLSTICGVLGDNYAAMHYLKNSKDNIDLLDFEKMYMFKLNINKCLLRQMNYSLAVIDYDEYIYNTNIQLDELTINLTLQTKASYHFLKSEYLEVIKCLKNMKEIGYEFYTSYYFLIYSFEKEGYHNEAIKLLKHLKCISSKFENLVKLNNLFEILLFQKVGKNELLSYLKKINYRLFQRARMGFSVIEKMLFELGIIK